MSGRLLKKLRQNSYYKPLLRTLAELGIEEYRIAPPTGRGHPMLCFKHGGEHRIPLPGSPAGWSNAQHYLRNEIRRRIAASTAPS
jgi:hypothetical protein